MMFQALVPSGGLEGYRFLQRTLERQQELTGESAEFKRNADAFRERIGSITTAQELVADRALLTVALGAFGLEDDINNKYLVQTILEEGTNDTQSLANKLADQRYQDFSAAFGFGDRTVPRTQLGIFPDEILDRYQRVSLEVSVGDQDESLRIALSADRELAELASEDNTDTTKWLTLLGNSAQRTLMGTALGLPDSVAQLDLDTQVGIFSSKMKRQLGLEITDLTDGDARDRVIERYLLRDAINTQASLSSGAVALTLLQG